MQKQKHEGAFRAGLLDPLIANNIVKAQTEDGTEVVEKKKAKRSPRPAAKIVNGDEIPGFGTLTFDTFGALTAASFVFRVMPVPKERPRIVKNKKTGLTQSYTPRRTEAFHKDIHRVLRSIVGTHAVMEGPLFMDMTFRMPVPTSWPKWKRAAALSGAIRPTGRPDMDNLEKALLDALNVQLIQDDSLVVERIARKIYADEAGIDLQVEKLLAGSVTTDKAATERLEKIRKVLN